MNELICSTCDFKINSTEKLQSHYAAVHNLSTHDSSVLAYGNLGFDLSFEQQQKIDHISLLANTPGSNQNKYRFELYALIEDIARERA